MSTSPGPLGWVWLSDRPRELAPRLQVDSWGILPALTSVDCALPQQVVDHTRASSAKRTGLRHERNLIDSSLERSAFQASQAPAAHSTRKSLVEAERDRRHSTVLSPLPLSSGGRLSYLLETEPSTVGRGCPVLIGRLNLRYLFTTVAPDPLPRA